MDTKVIGEVLCVSRHLNLRAAAKELFVSRSALSAHLASLEEELGVELFERDRTGLHLTDAGRVFVEGAQRILKEVDRTVEGCKQISGGLACIRFIARTPTAAEMRALACLPDVRVSLVEGDLDESSYSQLVRKRADIAFNMDLTLLPHARDAVARLGYRYIPRATRRRMGIVMKRDNRLALERGLTRKDLAGSTFVVQPWRDFADICTVQHAILGDNLRVDFQMCPVFDMEDMALFDFKDHLYFIHEQQVSRQFEQRKDIRIVYELDGEPMYVYPSLVYRDDKTVARFAEAFAASLAQEQNLEDGAAL